MTHCIKIQNVGAVEALLRCGADPNLANKKSVAPISGASHKGNIAIMKMLLDSGASVNVPNSTGSTALIQVFLSYIFYIFSLYKYKLIYYT